MMIVHSPDGADILFWEEGWETILLDLSQHSLGKYDARTVPGTGPGSIVYMSVGIKR